ncbi:MAG: SEC-C metal-binding domain-containing protein [Phycisphaerae bacterium]
MLNGKLDAEIEQALQQHPGDAILTWAKERFGIVLESSPLSLEGDLRQQLKSCSYEMLRFELTQLERTVLLSTFDAVWKDHMYAMDLLRQAIGLRGYAERDPKIEYKREGTRLFNEMLSNVRERVTDLIFKVHLPPPPDAMGDRPAALASGPDAGPAYAGMQAQKADATNVGFSSRDQQAAMANQGEAAQRQTIRRAMPKVGRNDPCPCGSGKKYKSCHGKGAA